MKRYDDASWHYQGDYPSDLDEVNAFHHIAFYMNFLIKKKMLSHSFVKEFSSELKAIEANCTSCLELILAIDGKLCDEDLNNKGNSFTQYIYSDTYYKTLEKIACRSKTIYHLENSANNYNKLYFQLNRHYLKYKFITILK